MRFFHFRSKYLMRVFVISMAFLFNPSAYGQDTAPKTYAELSSEEKSCLNAWLEPQNANIDLLIQNALLPSDSRVFPAIQMCRNYIDAYSKARKNVPCEYKGKAYQSCDEYWVQKNEPDIALSVNDISKLFGRTKTEEEVQKLNSQLSNGFFPNQSNLDQADSNKVASAENKLAEEKANKYQYTLKDHGMCALFFGQLQNTANLNNMRSDAKMYYDWHVQVLEKARTKGWTMNDLLSATKSEGYLIMNLPMMQKEYGDKCIHLRRGLSWDGG